MTKQKKAVRNTIDWELFFRLVRAGTSHEKIAEKMGIRLDKNSDDPLKPIRAMKSRAKTAGVRIDGKLCRLHVPKVRKPKAVRKPKVEATLAATA